MAAIQISKWRTAFGLICGSSSHVRVTGMMGTAQSSATWPSGCSALSISRSVLGQFCSQNGDACAAAKKCCRSMLGGAPRVLARGRLEEGCFSSRFFATTAAMGAATGWRFRPGGFSTGRAGAGLILTVAGVEN